MIQRIVGVIEQLCGRGGCRRIDRETGRTRDLYGGFGQMERRAKRGAHLLAEGDEVEVGCEIGDDKGEFVAAQSRQMDIHRPTETREPLADLDEELVAGRMTVEVVDRLEAVEVEHADRKPAAAASRRVEGLRQMREERAAVG